MPTRTLNVQVTGDARSLNKTLDSTESRTKKWSGRITAAGLAAGTGLAIGIKKSAEAAIEAEKSQARLEAQLKASGISYKAHARQIDEVIQKHSQLSGLDDEDLTDAFTNIVRVTGDMNKSLRLTGLAADFARAKHMDVAKAGELVAKVAGGNTGILSRYGIKIKEGATATEALGQLQQKFAGQAERYGKTTAGAGDRAAVAWENLKEMLGESLLPVLAKAGNALSQVLGWLQRNRTATRVLIGTVGALVAVMGTVMIVTKVAAALATLRAAVVAVNLAMRANPIGLVVTALALLVGGLVAAYKKSETFRNVVNAVFRAVKNAAITAIDFILGGVQRFLEGLARIFDAAGKLPGVGKKFRGLADDVRGAAADVGRLRAEMRELKSKKIKVDIELALDPAHRLVGRPGGDGIGAQINGAIQAGAAKRIGSMLPRGSTNLQGADFDLAPFASIGAGMGLSVSSGRIGRENSITSSGNRSYHASGDAVDMSGPPGAMMRFFRTMRSQFGSRLRELIYTPGGVGIKDGRPFQYSGQVAQDHFDHVHVAYTGPFGDGIGDMRNLWVKAGGRASAANMAAAIAMAESGGRRHPPDNVNTDGSVDRGPWQINSVHGRLSTHDPLGNARAAVRISGNGRNWAPWVTFKTGAYKRFLTSGGRVRNGASSAPRSRPMSPEEAVLQASQNAVDRTSTRFRNAASAAFGPAKGVVRDPGTLDDSGVGGGGDGSDPAADALREAIEANTRAQEEHKAALDAVTAEIKRNGDIAESAIASDNYQLWKWIADGLSGQLGRAVVGRGFTPGTGVEVAY